MGFLLSIIVGVSSGFLTSKEFALGFKCLNLRGDCLMNRSPSYFQKFTRFQMMKKHLKSKENWVYGIQLSRCGLREGESEKFGNLDLSIYTSMPLILGKHGDFKFFVFISDLICTLQLLKWMKLPLLCSFVLTNCDFVVYEDMVCCVNILE
jgi:hypothetical protein